MDNARGVSFSATGNVRGDELRKEKEEVELDDDKGGGRTEVSEGVR